MSKKNIIDSLIINTDIDSVIDVEHLPSNVENGRVYVINQNNPNSYTHGYFKYPCKFIPEIPRWAIQKYSRENFKIFDPFSGSGTTLLEANIHGYDSFGTEIDSLAKKITMVKTTPLSLEQLNFISEWLVNLNSKFSNSLEIELAMYFPDISNLEHWFTYDNILKLAFLKKEIFSVEDVKIKNLLEVCFASVIRKSSNADDASPKPYVSTTILKKPSNPLDLFVRTVNKYKNNMRSLTNLALSQHIGVSQIIDGDALNIPVVNQFDLAITSPPYINAFDYARTLRLENLWLNLESEDSIRNKKKDYVGTENITSKVEIEHLDILTECPLLKDIFEEISVIDIKRALIVKKFFEDMKKNLQEVYKSLKPGGNYCIVIGDSTIRKVQVKSWKILTYLAFDIGFELENYFGYSIQNHYLRIPRGNRGGKIETDIVFTLKKPL